MLHKAGLPHYGVWGKVPGKIEGTCPFFGLNHSCWCHVCNCLMETLTILWKFSENQQAKENHDWSDFLRCFDTGEVVWWGQCPLPSCWTCLCMHITILVVSHIKRKPLEYVILKLAVCTIWYLNSNQKYSALWINMVYFTILSPSEGFSTHKKKHTCL